MRESIGQLLVLVLTLLAIGCPDRATPGAPAGVSSPQPPPVDAASSPRPPPANAVSSTQFVVTHWINVHCSAQVLFAPGDIPTSVIPVNGTWEVQVDVSGPRDKIFKAASDLSIPNPRLETAEQPFAFVRLPRRPANQRETTLRLPVEVHGLPKDSTYRSSSLTVKVIW